MHESRDSRKAGYEVSDMRPAIIVLFVSAIFMLMVGGVIGALFVLRGFDRSRTPEMPPSALASEVGQVPEEPHLQQDPVAEKEKILAEAAARLNSYGLVSDNPEMKRAHIPIERAMELVASGQVPYRQTPTPAKKADAGTTPRP